MNGTFVRDYYQVPAYDGGRVVIDERPGVIIGFDQQYLLVRFEGATEPVPAHPTWRVTYLDAL